jgi:hypothetical protein
MVELAAIGADGDVAGATLAGLGLRDLRPVMPPALCGAMTPGGGDDGRDRDARGALNLLSTESQENLMWPE